MSEITFSIIASFIMGKSIKNHFNATIPLSGVLVAIVSSMELSYILTMPS